MTTWQQEIKACAKRWHAKKDRKAAKAKAKATAAKPEQPPKVPHRMRGKQQDPTRDIN